MMMKRSVAILTVVFGMVALLLTGCSKDNHDTIIHLGDESFKSPLDSIYPKQYRDLWKTVAPSCSDKVYEGIFPPDITGLYEMEGQYYGSDEQINQGGTYVPLVTPTTMGYYGKRYLYLLIEEQNNGVAKLKFKTKYQTPLPEPYDYNDWNEIDTAYIWGYGGDGAFTLCFECQIQQPGEKTYFDGFIVNGKVNQQNDDTPTSISNMEFWTVIKRRNPDNDQPGIMKVGGQNMYFSSLVVKKETE